MMRNLTGPDRWNIFPTKQAAAQKGDAARAKFTVFTMGSPFGGKSQQIDWKHLQTEYELPRFSFGKSPFRNWLENVLPRLSSISVNQIDFLLPPFWKPESK